LSKRPHSARGIEPKHTPSARRALVDAMRADCGALVDTVLRVDGGMVASDWTMGGLAEILGEPVDRPTIMETTALDAAYLGRNRASTRIHRRSRRASAECPARGPWRTLDCRHGVDGARDWMCTSKR
jgi:sugar (pentulose or hexulose) kinase